MHFILCKLYIIYGWKKEERRKGKKEGKKKGRKKGMKEGERKEGREAGRKEGKVSFSRTLIYIRGGEKKKINNDKITFWKVLDIRIYIHTYIYTDISHILPIYLSIGT